MQRIGYFFAVLRSLDMSLLIVSRRQRYNKVWKQQNNLKRNIKKRYDKGENLTPLLLLKKRNRRGVFCLGCVMVQA